MWEVGSPRTACDRGITSSLGIKTLKGTQPQGWCLPRQVRSLHVLAPVTPIGSSHVLATGSDTAISRGRDLPPLCHRGSCETPRKPPSKAPMSAGGQLGFVLCCEGRGRGSPTPPSPPPEWDQVRPAQVWSGSHCPGGGGDAGNGPMLNP